MSKLVALTCIAFGITISAAEAANPCREAVRTETPAAVKACYHSKRSAFRADVDHSIGFAIAKGDCRRFRERGEAYEICRIAYGTVGFKDLTEDYEMTKLPLAECRAMDDSSESFVTPIASSVPFDEMNEKAVCDAFEAEGYRRTAVHAVRCDFAEKALEIDRCPL